MPALESTVHVPLGDRAYDVLIGSDLLAGVGARIRGASGVEDRRRAFVVVDDQLPEQTIRSLIEGLSGARFDVSTELVLALEPEKSIETAHRLLARLAETRADRDDVVIALGGGIVGDVAGFVAATYKRGIAFVQCPTTLLAMVDASVGGKTGVNLATATGLKKNLVGAFWQPRLVVADVESLGSLDARTYRSGLAECVKHGMLAGGIGADPDLFDWTLARAAALRGRDPEAVTELVARNVAVKAAVVAGDEREESAALHSGRALLNLGHTFGHAIEPIAALRPAPGLAAPLLHGEAVALGLVAAGATAVALGLLSEAEAGPIREAVRAMGLPDRVDGLPGDEALLDAMGHDKKVRGGTLRLIVPERIGAVRIVENPTIEAVKAGLSALRAP